ncbi:glycosyl transferase family 2 [Natronomonas gomsonensis]|uniref:glycosyl transferase family 2 n=1 Tax=Natronomonas gomsonensis TaxID=1046043 RepID=UPI0015BA37DD|nr:glycosyl transferase family 2 [Natronomonas gomsonensis]
MEYVQERVTTLHDFGDAAPEAPTDDAAVVVPMTEREHAGLAAERVLSALETVAPERVVVPLRASEERVGSVASWLEGFDLPLELLWCDGPELGALLSASGLNGTRGKGRDVWLALGVAGDSDYVVVHDADAKNYDAFHVPKLLFPLAHGHEFSKGYYARVENDRLYGRLFRLFYRPLVEALDADTDAAVVEYLDSFRYALAGEFATTGALAREMRVQRGWGLEVGTLGEAFRLVGSAGSAQVDLGVHEHDHRAVSGPSGLSDMSEQVAAALLRAVEDNGGTPEYETLPARYRRAAERLVDAYSLDSAFNDLEYDRSGEREQVETYADAIASPPEDTRLPAWQEAAITPAEVAEAAAADLDGAVESVDAVPER